MKSKVVSKTSKQTSSATGSNKSVEETEIVEEGGGRKRVTKKNIVVGKGTSVSNANNKDDAESLAADRNKKEVKPSDGLVSPQGSHEGKSGLPSPGGKRR